MNIMNLKTSPLDAVEEFLFAKEWNSYRLSDDEIVVEVSGKYDEYNLHFVWSATAEIMYLIIDLPHVDMPKKYLKRAYELVALVNERAKIGHFEVLEKNMKISYRYGVLLSSADGMKESLFDALTTHAVALCDRFAPAFQFVASGNKTATQASEIAFIETIGQA